METKSINFTSKIGNFEIVNDEFIRCKCYMLATGDNANGSDITLFAVQKAIDRGEFYNKPVVAHLYKDESDNGKYRVGGHDSKWIISSEGIEEINECIPFGTIPESCGLKLETVLEPDGVTTNTYLVGEIILWTGRYNIMDASYSDDIYFNQSCELLINESEIKENGNLAINDFTFSALCLLNKDSNPTKNVRPCFPSCRVERLQNTFSLNNNENFNNQFELLVEKAKNIFTSNYLKETFTKEDKTLDFTNVIQALSNVGEQFSVISCTETTVNVFDKTDYGVYAISYTKTETDEKEEISFDLENKVEMALDAVELTEGAYSVKTDVSEIVEANSKTSVESAIATAQDAFAVEKEEAVKEISEKYQALLADYETLKAEKETADAKIAEYVKAEEIAQGEAHKAEINAVIDSYANKLEANAEYLMYKTKIDYSKTKEQVDVDMLLILGRANRDGKASFSYTPISWGKKDTDMTDDSANGRYGTLFENIKKD